MLRQSAFIANRPLLKGALHCHTTRSDGKLTPQESMHTYKAANYDFVALTDHRIYNYENYAPETGLTLIPGIEINRELSLQGVHTYHTVCLGPLKEDGNGFCQDERIPGGLTSGQEEFQKLLDMAHARNNLTIYCHPEWSGTPAREFEKLKGNIAMEIFNTSCVVENGIDRDAACWDELLSQGKRLWGVATDDSHGLDQICQGWVMVNAENSVNAILEGLKNGDFYSSCGPVIHDFYVENGQAHIACSPCASIRFVMDKVPSPYFVGEALTQGQCPVPPFCTYIRAAITDAKGRMAWTNPIWLEA